MAELHFEDFKIHAEFDTNSLIINGIILTGKNVSLRLPGEPQSYYTHGWQSWSLAAWTGLQALPASKPALLRPLQVDPVYAQHPSPSGSWVGAVEFADGKILLLGALELESRVQLRDGALQGWCEAGPAEWFVGYGSEIEVFNSYAQLLGKKFGYGRAQTANRVWCSWYSLYTAIDEHTLEGIFDKIGDLPFDVLQIDDGWQVAIGDWEANAKFPSGMKALTAQINATGRKAGLWLAPLLVAPSSRLYREHADWLLRDDSGRPVQAGFNWGATLYALDCTHPEALDWLAALMKQVRAWGFEYVKLDFMYAGALPGKRYQQIPREAAYRQGLAVIRKALGEDAYLLTCGTPILPALGLCDAIRIGPDVAAEWESYRDAVYLYNPATPGAKNAIRTTVNRLWLASLVHTDPDVAYFSTKENQLKPEEKGLLQDLALVCNFKATSDLPQWLSASERETLRDFLMAQPEITRNGRYTFALGDRAVDFSPAHSLPEPPSGINWLIGEVVGWLGSQPWVLRMLDTLGKRRLEKIKAGQ